MLPGKLCIGILEEDNPLKSYFRMKPLLIEADGRYVPFEGGADYPEDGCLRIVPDKNESSHFKARMRRMGKYCVLDLREHAGENDKIRPNKNYRNDETERNSHIVYSDVVREPAPDMIFEIVENLSEGEVEAAPGTSRILGEGAETWVYLPGEEDAPGRIRKDGHLLAESELQRIEVAGFDGMLRFAIRLPNAVPSVTGAPAARPEPVKSEPAPVAEKPWLSHDLASDVKVSLALQTGLNPRRGRSLQEIIEEKWRHSRVDQLGHPVPANAMGKPVESPVDAAITALRGAWANPEIRDQLVSRIAELESFSSALENRRSLVQNSALQHELEDLEAERLKSLTEIEHLHRNKQSLRESFKQEIRSEEAEAFRDAVEKTRRAQGEYERMRTLAEDARKTMDEARDFCNALKDGRFERELRKFALSSHAAKYFSHMNDEGPMISYASDDLPSREEWIDRVMGAFEDLGLPISQLQAANLLICIALDRRILLSGVAASDKRGVALALARALGAEGAGLFLRQDSTDFKPVQSEAISVALLRGFNLSGKAPARTLPCCSENLVLLCELYDLGAGEAISAEVLESCFLIRLTPVNEHAPWAPAQPKERSYSPVRMDALRRAFLKDAAVPPELEQRMQRLRATLKRYGVYLSRKSLNLTWRYCAAMVNTGLTSAEDAFDLAFAQRALPCILAQAPLECQADMRAILAGLPRCIALMDQPLPILI